MNDNARGAFTMKEAACGIIPRRFFWTGISRNQGIAGMESELTQILISDDPDADTGCALFYYRDHIFRLIVIDCALQWSVLITRALE